MSFESQLWDEITEGIDLIIPVKKVIHLDGTTAKLTLTGYGTRYTSEFDLNDPASIEKMKTWCLSIYEELLPQFNRRRNQENGVW